MVLSLKVINDDSGKRQVAQNACPGPAGTPAHFDRADHEYRSSRRGSRIILVVSMECG